MTALWDFDLLARGLTCLRTERVLDASVYAENGLECASVLRAQGDASRRGWISTRRQPSGPRSLCMQKEGRPTRWMMGLSNAHVALRVRPLFRARCYLSELFPRG